MLSIKKISLIIALAALSACGGNEQAEKPSTPQPAATAPQTAEGSAAKSSEPISAEILVGIDSSYAPHTFRDEDGQATGFDVEILKAIGEKQGLKFSFMPEKWASIMANLDSKKFKVAVAGFTRSDERAQKYQVSNTYAYGQDVIATLEKTTPTPETMADLKTRKVITLADSPYFTQLQNALGKDSTNIVGAPSSYFIVKELAAGNVDAAFIEKGVVQHYSKSFPDAKIKTSGKGSADFDKYEMVILANKDEAELMNKINAGLADIVKDGSYKAIYKKWFNEEPKELPAAK